MLQGHSSVKAGNWDSGNERSCSFGIKGKEKRTKHVLKVSLGGPDVQREVDCMRAKDPLASFGL